jgi:two-component system phosphate regulon sensor histidine kinase PhoR
MLFRLLSFALFQGAGALLAAIFMRVFAPFQGATVAAALVGALAATYFWLLWDLSRGLRVMRWLRSDETREVAVQSGLWGEFSNRIRRLLRNNERAVQQRDERLQEFLAAMQASPNGVVMLDKDFRIEWFNDSAGLHFGLDARRDLEQHFANLVRDPSFAAYFAAKDFEKDVLMPGRASTITLPVRLSVHVHPYGAGRSLLLSRDVTAVEQAEAMRRDFVANVSHEIRTPLTVLGGFVETLQTLSLNATERARYLDLMAQQASRMQSLVNDLLTLSRLEGSPLPSTQEWVDVSLLVDQCRQEAGELSRVLWGQAHSMSFEIQTGLSLAGSASELHSAFFNLIGNAVRYTPAEKSIRVIASVTEEGGAQFAVYDQGMGIAQEHIGRLTERFYRVDRSRSRDTGGTGLGLAIVKHVVQRHGAELSISSIPGEGSRFQIGFPPHRVQVQAVQAPAQALAD